jgi:hypothetical protein
MPNTKQFEAFDINDLIFGSGEIKYLDMFELSDQFFVKIKEILKYLSEEKVASIEIPNEDCLYNIKKVSSELFLIKMNSVAEVDILQVNGIELVNWLFAKAPFMAMVGYSNI